VERQKRITYLRSKLYEYKKLEERVRQELQELFVEEWVDKADGLKYSKRGRYIRKKKEY
jgi:hypothetical protein